MVVYVIVVLLVVLAFVALSVRILKQYERGVQFRLGQVIHGARGPGLIFIIPLVDRVHRVSLRIVTMPIQSQGIITRDNVSVDVSAVAYYRVADVVRSVVAIENVSAAINQIAQTTLRAVVGRHTLDETLSETDTINQNIREILDVQTEEWGIEVTVVELKDIQLPESMKRAMARQAEAEREKRAKIIAAQGEALAAGELAAASDVMLAHPLALQLRTLQTLAEIAVDRNSTVVFPAPLMSTIQELGAFLNRDHCRRRSALPCRAQLDHPLFQDVRAARAPRTTRAGRVNITARPSNTRSADTPLARIVSARDNPRSGTRPARSLVGAAAPAGVGSP
jgi:regulator of protease activity HflC (stomatin/prohibitin superfamily)